MNGKGGRRAVMNRKAVRRKDMKGGEDKVWN